MSKKNKKVERPGLSNEEVDEIKQAFDLFDTNGTGKIDRIKSSNAIFRLR